MSKKKILLLSDDLRMHSGIATQSKEFVMGTIHKYDWVQLGGAVKHPEQGKIIDMSQAVQNEYGIKDASLKIYPISGYGNQQQKNQTLSYILLTQDFGFGCIKWNTKLDKIFLFYITTFGMIYPTHYIILTIIEVRIC